MKIIQMLLLFSLYSALPMKAEVISKEGTIAVSGGSLYYIEIGEGEPIVILHGGPGLDHSYFLPQMEALSKKHRLIFFDQRACGKSSIDVDSSSITMDQFVEDLEMLRQFFKLEKMNLMGHSFGGLLAMRYAIKYPDHLKTLMLVNSSSATSDWRDSSFALMAAKRDTLSTDMITQLMKSQEFKNREPETMTTFFRLLFKTSFYNPERVEEINFNFQKNYASSSKMMNYLMKDSSLTNYNLNVELKKLIMPTLIIGSEADIIPPMALEELHQNLKNSTYVFIEGCGHFPFIEEPEQFLKAIDKFFARL